MRLFAIGHQAISDSGRPGLGRVCLRGRRSIAGSPLSGAVRRLNGTCRPERAKMPRLPL